MMKCPECAADMRPLTVGKGGRVHEHYCPTCHVSVDNTGQRPDKAPPALEREEV